MLPHCHTSAEEGTVAAINPKRLDHATSITYRCPGAEVALTTIHADAAPFEISRSKLSLTDLIEAIRAGFLHEAIEAKVRETKAATALRTSGSNASALGSWYVGVMA